MVTEPTRDRTEPAREPGAATSGMVGGATSGVVGAAADPPRRARVALTYTFAATGALFGSWAPRVVEVKRALGLSEAALGFALLAVGAGSLIAMPLAGAAAARWGSAPVTRVLLAAYCLSYWPVGLAPGLWSLWAVLLLAGAAGGALDVCMNAQAVSVAARYGRPVMASFHAAFSVGTLAGAGVGSAAAVWGIPLAAQLGGFGLVLIAVGWPLSRAFVPDRATAGPPGPVFALPRGRMLVLGVAAYAALLGEGAVGDWSAVHLREVLGAATGAAGLGFVAFAVTMTAGRMVGDRVTHRLGPVRTIRVCAGIGAVGMAGGLLTGTVTGAVVGYALLGVGLSCAVPVIFSAAGSSGPATAPSIAAVFTCGYLGFLTGPTLIGALAHLTGLGTAVWMMVAVTATVGLLAPAAASAGASAAAAVPAAGEGQMPARQR